MDVSARVGFAREPPGQEQCAGADQLLGGDGRGHGIEMERAANEANCRRMLIFRHLL